MSDLLRFGFPDAGDETSTGDADCTELTALRRRTFSLEELARALKRETDLDDEEARTRAVAAFAEIQNRLSSIGSEVTYPFNVVDGEVLESRYKDGESSTVYIALLLMSRASMASGVRTKAGVDPTSLFERMCADVMEAFWGGPSDRVGLKIVGTSSGRTPFRDRIDSLCRDFGEGGGWNEDALPRGTGDGGLDIAVWLNFADRRPGTVSGFAQCKTGIHWRDELPMLNPGAFIRKYMRSREFGVEPVRIFMVPHRIGQHEWRERTLDGGLLFDRCRIAEHASSVRRSRLAQCRKWSAAILDEMPKS